MPGHGRLSWPPPSQALKCTISSSPTIPGRNGAAKSTSQGSSPPCLTLICHIPTIPFGTAGHKYQPFFRKDLAVTQRGSSASHDVQHIPWPEGSRLTRPSLLCLHLLTAKSSAIGKQNPGCLLLLSCSSFLIFFPASRTKPLHADPLQGWSCLSSLD